MQTQIRYEMNPNNFSKIPGSPIAYWVSDRLMQIFHNKILYDYSISPSQNITGNNDRFLRKWWEMDEFKIGGYDSWIFYAKGGGYRKWYGNLEDIINWTPEARYIYQYGDGKHASQIINKEYWYKKAITWGLISSYAPSFRVMPEGATFDKGGSSVIVDEDLYYFVISLLNSKVYIQIVSILNPTLNYQVKDIRNLPIEIKHKNEIDYIGNENIDTCKQDWDSFETSWDFKRHPLI